MGNNELLKWAAKAAGPHIQMGSFGSGPCWLQPDEVLGGFKPWNPLRDDGDALRLAVRLGLNVIQQQTFKGPEPVAAACGFSIDDYRLTSTNYGGDPYAATRLTIVRAAAEIGKAMR
jgi:hypothetical protein